MRCCTQCEATSGCPLSYLLAPFPPRMDYLLTGNQPTWACMSLWVKPVRRVRGTWEPRSCMAGLVGIPWSWHPAP